MNGGNGGGGRVLVVGIGGTMRAGSASLAALRRSLGAAAAAGARTELLDLRELRLPIYEPDVPFAEYGANVRRFVESIHAADALLLGTAAYHGTLAGVTKNALDFAEFLADADPPYLHGKVVGLIATAAGGQAAPNAIGALVQTSHALRAVVAPISVVIPRAWTVIDDGGAIAEAPYGRRLDDLGRMVVGLAGKLRAADAVAVAPEIVGHGTILDVGGGEPEVPEAELVGNVWFQPDGASAGL